MKTTLRSSCAAQKNWVTKMPPENRIYVPRIVRPLPLPRHTKVVMLDNEPHVMQGFEVSCTYIRRVDKWRFVGRITEV